MSTEEVSFSQSSNVPREVQEMIIASAETIKQNKITIDEQKKRIDDCKQALKAAQDALILCQQNHSLAAEIEKNYQTQIDQCNADLAKMESDMKTNEENLKKETGRKKAWRAVGISSTLIAIVLIFI
jgi:chromosome segregation ATPase